MNTRKSPLVLERPVQGLDVLNGLEHDLQLGHVPLVLEVPGQDLPQPLQVRLADAACVEAVEVGLVNVEDIHAGRHFDVDQIEGND